MKDYSIVIPAHNEAENIGPFVRQFLERLTPEVSDSLLEVLLIENGSTDSTMVACEQLQVEFPGLVRAMKVSHPSYGEAIKFGMLQAQGSFVSILECDFLDENFAQLSLSLLRAGEADVVIASKRHRESVDERPFKRRMLTLGFNLMLNVFCRYPGSDTHGLKTLRADLAKELCSEAQTTDELFQTEIVLIAWKKGAKIKEVPIEIREKRSSPVSIARRFPKVVRMVSELRRSMARYPAKK